MNFVLKNILTIFKIKLVPHNIRAQNEIIKDNIGQEVKKLVKEIQKHCSFKILQINFSICLKVYTENAFISILPVHIGVQNGLKKKS